MHPKIVIHPLAITPTNHQLPDVTPKEAALGTRTNGGIGFPEVTFRNRSPTEAVGGMVLIKIK